ncbi:MAG: hypothetical protein M3441_13405 [Chloroflexota bacterium]|nr:hypothetical protein [Chloroflexota bacterium]
MQAEVPNNEFSSERIPEVAGQELTGHKVEDLVIESDTDEIVESERAGSPDEAVGLFRVLREMGETYRADAESSVRDQTFIKLLHGYIGSQLDERLTKFAKRRGIAVRYEAKVLGSTKPKNVDVAVVDPENGPLVLIGIRSQMSSIGKNVLGYYENIVGECISLQDRFPMSVHGYVYLHPLTSIKEGKEAEHINHSRYARIYETATGRSGPAYKNLRGIFDQFAYMVVDFQRHPPQLRDEVVQTAVPNLDMSIDTFVERLINTFNSRTLFWDVFK